MPRQLLPFGLPLIGQPLGRYFFSHVTRDATRKFWGQVIVRHPEKADGLVIDVDVANMRRNVETMVSLIDCIADFRSLGYRSRVVLGERWQDLTTPTLLVWGERDVFASPKYGEALVATNPNLRLVRISGAGHLAWFDDPETVITDRDAAIVR